MKVLTYLMYLMRVGEKAVQRQVALALAHLCSPDDQRSIFIDNNGMSYIYGFMVFVLFLLRWYLFFDIVDIMV